MLIRLNDARKSFVDPKIVVFISHTPLPEYCPISHSMTLYFGKHKEYLQYDSDDGIDNIKTSQSDFYRMLEDVNKIIKINNNIEIE